MKQIRIVIAVLFCLSAFLSACGGGAAPTQEAAKPQFAVYALNSEPLTNWDPAIEFSNGIHVHNNMYEQLLRYDPASKEMIPLLAESYTVSDDGLIWTFKIRQGVKFQNGDPMSAEDVKYSIDRTMSMGAGASYIWSAVESITVKDPQTVEFKLSYNNPLDLVAATGYAAFIYSKKCVNDANEWIAEAKGCGTGPYMLKSAKWGDEVIVEAFPDYWGGWGEKYFSQVVFKKISESATRRQMIEAGRHRAGQRPLHVDRAAAVERVAGDGGRERRMGPARVVAGRHHVGMAREGEVGRCGPDAGVKVLHRRGAGFREGHAVDREARALERAFEHAKRAAVRRRHRRAA